MEALRAVNAHNKAWRLEMESKRIYRPVFADSHHFEEELDPGPHKSEKLDLDLHADKRPYMR
jgi:hypothetical protein